MGFFSDLKEDLSQAVNELMPAADVPEEKETPAEEVSLEAMLENIDEVRIPEDMIAEAPEEFAPEETRQTEEEPADLSAQNAEPSLEDMLAAALDAIPDEEENAESLVAKTSVEDAESPAGDAESSVEDLEPSAETLPGAEAQNSETEILGVEIAEETWPEEETGPAEGTWPAAETDPTAEAPRDDEVGSWGSSEETAAEFSGARTEEPGAEFPTETGAAASIADVTSEEAAAQEADPETIEERKGAMEDMDSYVNRQASDEVGVITEGMHIHGDIISEGSVDVIGTVEGNIEILGKLNITGHINGNSKAAEVYAEGAKIDGEVVSEGAVKIGDSSVIIGNISAKSAAIAGAVKGDIDVQGPVILDSSAIVMGNIKSKSVQINNGAVIEGMCSQCYADVNPTSFFDEYKSETKSGKKAKQEKAEK